MEEKLEKYEIIREISQLLESDPNAIPMELSMLDFLEEDELLKIRNGLLRQKEIRPKENQAWFDELVEKCGK